MNIELPPSPSPAPPRPPLFVRSQGSGARVVCLHSSSGSHAQWRGLAEALAGACRVFTPDLHGHGRSPAWPAQVPSTLDIDGDAVMRAVDTADAGAAAAGVHLVGHSYGGAVALHIALRHPGSVRSLTLYEPAAFGILRATAPGDAASAEIESVARSVETRLCRGETEDAARAFVDYWGGEGAWQAMSAAQREAVQARMPTIPRHFDALFHAAWSEAALRGLGVPLLLLRGTATRASARRVTECLSQAVSRLRRIDFVGAGHLGPMTHESAVNAAILDHLQRAASLPLAEMPAEPALV